VATCLEFVGTRAMHAIDDALGHLPEFGVLPGHGPGYAYALTAGNLLMGAGIAWLLLLARRRGIDTGLRRGHARRATLLALPLAAINLIAWLSPAGDGAQLHPLHTVAAFIVVALAIGIGEELVYRGAIMAACDVTRYPTRAVACSALIFGWFHVIDGWHVATDATTLVNALQATLLIGVPFALVRVRTGSLWGLVVGHAAYDFVALLDTGRPGAPASSMALVTSTVIAAMTCALYVWWYVEGATAAPLAPSPETGVDTA
jgi:membrane protease YdiL (CAAX protease family)